MKQFHLDQGDLEQLTVYQKHLRKRSNLSIQQLNNVLEPMNPDRELLSQFRMRVQQKGWSGAFQDLVPMLHNQSDYIQLLEAEVRLCKGKKAEEIGDHANLDKAKRVAELEEQLGRLQTEKSSLADQLQTARRHIIDQDRNNATRVAELEEQLGNAQREKRSLTHQLQTARRHVTDQHRDNATISADHQYQYNQAKWEKEQVERELSNLKIRNIRQLENLAKEVEGLSSELAGCRIHLGVVQKEGSQWQDKALSLTEQLADAQRQLNLTRHAVKSAERSHKEMMESTALSAQERHRDTLVLLERTEAQYEQRVGEQDRLLSSQKSKIKKLGNECNRLVAQLEEMAEKHRRKKKDLQKTITSLARCFNLQEQNRS